MHKRNKRQSLLSSTLEINREKRTHKFNSFFLSLIEESNMQATVNKKHREGERKQNNEIEKTMH